MTRSFVSSVVLSFCLLGLVSSFQGQEGQDPAADVPAAGGEAPAADPVVSTANLGGEQRFLTYLSTDKPMYRPGEVLLARGVLLHHSTNRPLSSPEVAVRAVAEVIGPKGESLASGFVSTEDSVLGCRWDIPANVAGGEYTLRVSYPHEGYPTAERRFDVRAYRAPRMKSQIEFARDGYGPGDTVVATLEVKRSEGGIPVRAKVRITARVDGAEVCNQEGVVDASGVCTTSFPLPKEIRRGQGSIAMAVQDGGALETATKTIPILLRTVDLTFYPEGGDLVQGVPNRVYFAALTPSRKPADLEGIVVDSDGTEITFFQSKHEGRGHFTFTPEAGRTYSVKISEPSGIEDPFPLPEAKTEGVVLRSTADQYESEDPIAFELFVGGRSLEGMSMTLSKREKQLDRQSPVVVAGEAPEDERRGRVEFRLPSDAPSGVLVATLWDGERRPVAERLVFRRPASSIRVEITGDKESYVPGGKAKVDVKTTDQRGRPVSAVVGLCVTDDSVLQMIDRREQAPRLPAMVLLENDVLELNDAHVYLDRDNPDAFAAIDLLLGTQGWRRFAIVADRAAGFLQRHRERAARVLALSVPSRPAPVLSEWSFRWRKLNENEVLADEVRRFDGFAFQMLNRRELVKDLKELNQAFFELEAGDRAFGRGRGERAGFGVDGAVAVGNDFAVIRVYAHQVRDDRPPGQRVDFTETLFWHAGLETDEAGQATFEFGMNDSVTSFRISADAFSSDGALGQSSTLIESVEPFYVEPKLPLEVTSGDRIRAPIALVNSTDQSLSVTLTGKSPQLASAGTSGRTMELAPGARMADWMTVDVDDYLGEAEFTVAASAGPYVDEVTRSVTVRPFGFPVEDGAGGVLYPNDSAGQSITIPADVVAGTVRADVKVYPTPLANLTEALSRLIQEPSGCFEQTSSTVYPLVMAQQYFLSHSGVDASLIRRGDDTLERGYQRLLGFECPGGGFEWFGKDPGHDALTAYGLLEFTDMSQVRYVDPAMLRRTRQWLLDQRDGQGGYARKTHTHHCWLPDPEVSATYNTWALLSAGIEEGLEREIEWAGRAGESSENTYVQALAANVLQLGGDRDGANRLRDELAGRQNREGWLDGATTSVVGSGGEALKIETTALAVTAWLPDSRFDANVELAMKWLAETCKAGRFGSTQSTILALRAILAYDQTRAVPKAPGQVALLIDGRPVGEPVAFAADTQGAIVLPDPTSALSAGTHQVEVRMTDGSRMPYTVAVRYHRETPASSENCKLHFEVALTETDVPEGTVTTCEVTVVNRGEDRLPSPIAIVGVPGGLEPDHDQLKELVKQGTIAAYEVRGREIQLYWRVLETEQRIDVPLRLLGAVPGTYTGPASRAYLYYTDEDKVWVPGLKASVVERGGK